MQLILNASTALVGQTMHPGDLFAMGTPAGVGVARNPPVFMKAADVAVCTVENIGTLTNSIVAH